MATKISLHAGPAAGFDQPFEMLMACHERIERMLSLLGRIADRVNVSGPDQDCCAAATEVMRYFDLAGPAHHQDEEIHVVPLLKSGSAQLQQLADRIEQEHLLMTDQWQQVREDLLALNAAAATAFHEFVMPAGYAQRWLGFARVYRAHIAFEEAMVFGRVSSQLEGSEILRMGQEMALRRQCAAD